MIPLLSNPGNRSSGLKRSDKAHFCHLIKTLLKIEWRITLCRIVLGTLHLAFKNPAKSNNLNFHPLEVVSRYRDPQLQVTENY